LPLCNRGRGAFRVWTGEDDATGYWLSDAGRDAEELLKELRRDEQFDNLCAGKEVVDDVGTPALGGCGEIGEDLEEFRDEVRLSDDRDARRPNVVKSGDEEREMGEVDVA
jgi:hypothetical protein